MRLEILPSTCPLCPKKLRFKSSSHRTAWCERGHYRVEFYNNIVYEIWDFKNKFRILNTVISIPHHMYVRIYSIDKDKDNRLPSILDPGGLKYIPAGKDITKLLLLL